MKRSEETKKEILNKSSRGVNENDIKKWESDIKIERIKEIMGHVAKKYKEMRE